MNTTITHTPTPITHGVRDNELAKYILINKIYEHQPVRGFLTSLLHTYLTTHDIFFSLLTYNKESEINIYDFDTIVVTIYNQSQQHKEIFTQQSTFILNEKFIKTLKKHDESLYKKMINYINKTKNDIYIKNKHIIENNIKENKMYLNTKFLKTRESLLHTKILNNIKYDFYIYIDNSHVVLKILNTHDDIQLIYELEYIIQ